MLRIQTANLPAEQQQQLHSDFIANEQHYLRMRPELLKQYRGQWVAVHDGQVIAHGEDLVTVMDAVGRAGCHAFVALVGREDDMVFRYLGYAEINGSVYPALIQAVPGARERLMGRDVLNRLRVTFDGPALKVTFET